MRPATYEHKQEAEVLKRVFSHRDGSLQNTSFGLLGPDGKLRLSRGGRSPSMVWRDKQSMISALERGTKKYKPHKGQRSLPTVIDLRLGLNIAASDNLPLVVLIVPKKKSQRASLEEKLSKLAWSDDLIGGAHYVVLEDHKALEDMKGHKPSKQVQVLKPDAYGQSAEVVGALNLKDKGLEKYMAELLLVAKGDPKDQRRHIRNGRRKGISWESLLPITDRLSTDR